MKIGSPLKECYDVYLLLLDGKITRLSIHEEMLSKVNENIGVIWNNVLAAFKDEELIAQTAVVTNPKSDEQLEIHRKNVIDFAKNKPLGILAIERTLDRGEREKAKRSH